MHCTCPECGAELKPIEPQTLRRGCWIYVFYWFCPTCKTMIQYSTEEMEARAEIDRSD